MRRFVLMVTLLLMPAAVMAQPCTIEANLGIAVEASAWHGRCVDGKANGRGSAVFYGKEKKQLAIFFGATKAGVPKLGVYELDAGYKVVAMQSDTSDPQTRIDAFRAAEKAAHATAAQFKTARNTASAEYYTKAATRLTEQLE